MKLKTSSALFLGFVLFNLGVTNVLAGACDSKIVPLTDCTQDQNIYGYFEDPSISTIKNNNCSAFTKKINTYCTQYCREEAETKFPKVINPMAVDRYQPILGGNHFQWDNASIIVKKECETVIDYNRWKKDYQKALSNYKTAVERLFAEWHQIALDVPFGDYRYRSVNDGSSKDGSCWSKNTYKQETWIPFDQKKHNNPNCDEGINCGTGKKPKECNKPGVTICRLDEVPLKKNPDGTFSGCPNGYGVSYHLNAPGGKPKEMRCGQWYIATTVGKKGKWRYTQMATYPWSGGSVLQGKNYCDVDGTPYWDGSGGKSNYQIDKYKNQVIFNAATDHWKIQAQTQQNNMNQLISQLRACNNTGAMNQLSTPVVEVTYTDPTKNYTTAAGRKVKYDGKKKVLEAKTDKKESAPVTTSDLQTINCSLPSSPSDVANMTSIYQKCEIKKFEYTTLFNSKVSSSVKNEYVYTMPTNVYKYILKETGEAVDSNSSKLTTEIKENYRYINIGYPNYPVHYTTPTGEYPIYLTYTNVGTNGYFTNKFPNKTGRYDCTYKVINRIKTCPNGECPDPDNPGDGGNGGGGKDNPLGINVVYRPISLADPFPGEDGKGRTAGQNWSNDDIYNYITKNRGTTENNVYKETPLYSFTLDAKAIKAIRNYNKGRISLGDYSVDQNEGYSDFNLTCSNKKNGKQCKSKFLKNITDLGVKINANKCLNSSDFYGCAGKPNQDEVYCSLNEKNENKYECINCGLPQNYSNEFCVLMRNQKKEGNK